MKAVSRLGIGLSAAVLALGPLPAHAQEAGNAVSNTPASDSIGPRELRNFSLEGTVTRPADPQPAPTPAPTPPRAAARTDPTATRTSPAPTPPVRAQAPAPAVTREAASDRPEPVRITESTTESKPASSVTVALPRLPDEPVSTAVEQPAPSTTFSPDAEPQTGNLAPEHRLPMLPWLFAAVALGVGLAFLFWRNRSREAFAGGPQIDAFAAPEPAPPRARAPTPPAAPAPRHPPASVPGLVSTRLRPWVDFGFQPLRCIVDERQVAVEFELELFNSGSAPARGVLVEATLFNAGPSQDREMEGFFSNPVGEGERIASIAPLKRMTLRTQVTIPREQVRIFEVEGRKLFVPLIGFNALYSWSSGEGQSSTSYLVGRDTKGEKMAPFRTDLGPRVFRGLGSRLLPAGVRR